MSHEKGFSTKDLGRSGYQPFYLALLPLRSPFPCTVFIAALFWGGTGSTDRHLYGIHRPQDFILVFAAINTLREPAATSDRSALRWGEQCQRLARREDPDGAKGVQRE
jgi:hypothetical protein